MPPGDIHEVRLHHVLRIGQRAFAEQPHKRLAPVCFLERIRDVPWLDAIRRRAEDRGMNAAIHRHEVRRKIDRQLLPRRQRQLLLDLREMPVLRDAVGAQALVTFRKKVIDLRIAARAAHATHRAHHDALRLQQPPLQQRIERENDARRVTPRRGHELRTRDLLPVNLRQAIHTQRRQLRRVMHLAVKFVIDRHVLDPKIRTQIDDPQPRGDERLRVFRSHPMRQREKDKLRARLENARNIRLDERQLGVAHPGKFRKDLPDRLPRELPRSQRDQLHPRMANEQPHELLP